MESRYEDKPTKNSVSERTLYDFTASFNKLLNVARQCGAGNKEAEQYLNKLLSKGYSLRWKHPESQLTIVQLLVKEKNDEAVYTICLRCEESVPEAIEMATAINHYTSTPYGHLEATDARISEMRGFARSGNKASLEIHSDKYFDSQIYTSFFKTLATAGHIPLMNQLKSRLPDNQSRDFNTHCLIGSAQGGHHKEVWKILKAHWKGGNHTSPSYCLSLVGNAFFSGVSYGLMTAAGRGDTKLVLQLLSTKDKTFNIKDAAKHAANNGHATLTMELIDAEKKENQETLIKEVAYKAVEGKHYPLAEYLIKHRGASKIKLLNYCVTYNVSIGNFISYIDDNGLPLNDYFKQKDIQKYYQSKYGISENTGNILQKSPDVITWFIAVYCTPSENTNYLDILPPEMIVAIAQEIAKIDFVKEKPEYLNNQIHFQEIRDNVTKRKQETSINSADNLPIIKLISPEFENLKKTIIAKLKQYLKGPLCGHANRIESLIDIIKNSYSIKAIEYYLETQLELSALDKKNPPPHLSNFAFSDNQIFKSQALSKEFSAWTPTFNLIPALKKCLKEVKKTKEILSKCLGQKN